MTDDPADPATARHLRATADSMPTAEVARVVGRVAAMAGFDDLVGAASALVEAPEQPQARVDRLA